MKVLVTVSAELEMEETALWPSHRAVVQSIMDHLDCGDYDVDPVEEKRK